MANAAAVQHLVFHPFKRTSGQYLYFIATSATHRVLVARLEKGTGVSLGTPEDIDSFVPLTSLLYLDRHHHQPDISPRVHNQPLPRHGGNTDFVSS